MIHQGLPCCRGVAIADLHDITDNISIRCILTAVRLRTWQTRFELGLDLKSRFRFRHYAGLDLDHSPSSQVGWTWTPGSEPGP